MILETINNVRILFERNSSKIINIQILTDIGSSDETENIYGMAHFLEHMCFKGTAKRNAKRINLDADLMGAKLNAWTWHDQTNYHLSVMSENFEKGFELLSDLYLNPVFPEDEFEKEKTVIISEIRRYEDDPSSYISDIAVDHFCESGNAHKITGTVESVTNIKREQLIQFKNRYYGSRNILISVAGDMSFEEVKRIAGKYFIPSDAELPLPLQLSGYRKGEIIKTKAEIQEIQYELLYPALPYLHPKASIQSIMTFVLGGNSSALLYDRIREELGLCYGIYARANRFEGFNYIDISTSCSDSDKELMHKEVLNIVNNLKNNLIDSERLEMVKASMLSNLYMSIESSAGLNSFLALGYMKGDRGDFLQKRINEIKSATREDIRDIAAETFSAEPLLSLLLPA